MAKKKDDVVEEKVEAKEEAPVVEEVVPEPVPEKKFNFDVWYALREKQIPSKHMKEIILADFKGRGLTSKETLATFDAALRKYGVKL